MSNLNLIIVRKEDIIEAFKKWNDEYTNYPDKFVPISDCDAQQQAEFLLKNIDHQEIKGHLLSDSVRVGCDSKEQISEILDNIPILKLN